MALEGEQGVVASHTTAVVGNLNKLPTACLDLDADACRSGIEGIFQKLLNYRSWTLHHLAGGDLVGDVLRKDVDAAHVSFGLQSLRATCALQFGLRISSSQFSVE